MVAKNSSKSIWTENEIEELKALYEKYKDLKDFDVEAKQSPLTTTIEIIDENKENSHLESIDNSKESAENSTKPKKNIDLIDIIAKNLSFPKSRRQIIRQLKLSVSFIVFQ